MSENPPKPQDNNQKEPLPPLSGESVEEIRARVLAAQWDDALVRADILEQNANTPEALSDEEVNTPFEMAQTLREEGVVADPEKAGVGPVGELDAKDRANKLVRELGNNEELLAKVDSLITEDREGYLGEHQDDDPEGKEWSFREAAVVVLSSVSVDEGGELFIKDEWRKGEGAFDEATFVNILRRARKLRAERRKAERKGEAAEPVASEKTDTTDSSLERKALEKQAYDSVVSDLRGLEQYDFAGILGDIDEYREHMQNNPNYKGIATYGKAAEGILASNYIGNYYALHPSSEGPQLLNRDKIVQAIRQAQKERDALPRVEQETPQQEIARLGAYVDELKAIDTTTAEYTDHLKLRAKIGRAENRLLALTEGLHESATEEIKPVVAEPEPVTYEKRLADVKTKIAEIRQQFSNQAFRDEGEKSAKRQELRALIDQERNLKENTDTLKQQDADRQLDADLAALNQAGKTDEEARTALRTRFGNLRDKNSDEGRRIRATLGGLNARIDRVDAAEQEAIGAQVDALAKKLGITPEEGAGREPLSAALDEPVDAQQGGREPLSTTLDEPVGTQSGREPLSAELDDPAGQENLTEPTDEELKAYVDHLLDEYNELEDKNSPEAAAIFQTIRETLAKLGTTPESDTPEQQERGDPEIERILGEVEISHGATYKAALRQYAELKATSETKGRIGRHSREEQLKLAEATLTEAKVAYVRELMKHKKEAGKYAEMTPQAVSDEAFDLLRGVDKDTREATDAVHEQRLNERGRFKRAFAAVGRFLTKGGKVARIAKPAGAGLVAGAGTALLVTATGAVWPVTAAVGASLGLAVRGAATRANLDVLHAKNNGKNAMNDTQFGKLLESIRGSGQNVERSVIGGILNESREAGYKLADTARKKAGKTALAFALGFGAGGAGVHAVHNAFFSGHEATASGHEAPAGEPKPDQTPQNKPDGVNDTGLDEQIPSPELHGQKFTVESGHGVIEEIQEAAQANGHKISAGRAEDIYNQLYGQYGDKIISGGPEYHGPTGDIRFGKAGSYEWGNDILEKIVSMSK